MPEEWTASLPPRDDAGVQHVDVAVVGAGFAGLYLLHRLRKGGFTAMGLDAADDVGGTWYWNRYPGARCDVQTLDYTYTFDPELGKAWTWSEKYATQPEILRYLGFVADRYDLRRDIRFGTNVTRARWNEGSERWLLETSSGPSVSCRHYIMATGCLSSPKPPEIAGARSFKGETLTTGRWPHGGVDLAGKRVAVIGTGSSAIQLIPIVAEQAAELVVFQRTPNFALPARNGAPSADRRAQLESDREGYRAQAKLSRVGVPFPIQTAVSWQLTDAERRERFEKQWAEGDLVGMLTQLWADQGVDVDGNAIVADLIREKIRSVVKDPETAETLTPRDHPFGSKRPCLDTNYYATFNRPNITLVDLRKQPIVSIGESGIRSAGRNFDVDVIIFATGFDAMTGAVLAINPVEGRGGRTLAALWARGPKTYLGLMAHGFPNFYMITGPRQPVGAVQHGRVDRAACRLGGRSADRDARRRFHHDRADRDGAGGLGAASRRLRSDHDAPAGQHLVHGRQRAGQAARRHALYRRRRALPRHLRRGGPARHDRLPADRPDCRRTMQRRGDRAGAAGRPRGARPARANEAAAGRVAGRGGRPRFPCAFQRQPSLRAPGRRGRRRNLRWSRRPAPLSALSS